MDSLTLTSSTGRFVREAHYLAPPSPARKLAVFLDAEYYVERMDAPSCIAGLQESGAIPPTACLFISGHGEEARHHDYTCSDPFAAFIANDVLPWLRKRNGVAAAADHLVAGVSLSGLQAVHTSLSHGHAIGLTLCQSGSFWWENEWLRRHLQEYPAAAGKYWLSVGSKEKGAGMVHPPTAMRQEIDQDTGVEHFSSALAAHGACIHTHRFDGGHDCNRWKEELPAALAWLLNPSPKI